MQTNYGDAADRLQLLEARYVSLTETLNKFRKLNLALDRLAVADKSRQLHLIRSATAYLDKFEIPTGVKPILATIRNELQSLREGIIIGIIRPKDLVLLSGLQAVEQVTALRAKVLVNRNKVSASIGDADAIDPNKELIKRNQALREKLPSLNGKDFVIGHAPTAFTFQQKNGHSSVGYVDSDRLKDLGFKADNLGGYTILHNQMVLGVNSDSVYAIDKDGKKTDVRQRVGVSVTTFKANRPMTVKKHRDKEYLDVAKALKLQIEKRTNQPYAFVSELGVGLNGGHWFWVMPARDLSRLSKAFPGGHAKISRWGFGF